MKKNSRKMKTVSILVALFVFSNISVANAAGFKVISKNNDNCALKTTKINTFNFSDYLNKYGNIIKIQTKKNDVNTDKPAGTEAPKPEAQKPETQKPETSKPETPVNNNEEQKPVDQPSNDNKDSNLGDVSAIEKEVVRLVNVERQKNGLNSLEIDAELSKVARMKSQDMATKGYFSHTSPTYGSPFDMMKQFGIKYSTAGENIAMGQPSAEAVVKAWMNSEGHRANILSKNFTKIGVGYYKGSNEPYWTQMFIKPY
ncbi:CAP domain-containing protein [Proteiniborus sp. MB09-C3]|uniref:CAP domain-containing protein n=1 Tax=Proteiniborus sp. MB09-C3 TaxID=3050072 RepID=UPI0025539370|nr:CAP domain-containing protein [Proteiniborus sp. MB09-C3]WIV11457.1 CAP domain-containing protein [Proteiniborus sp. MB09-C3]